MVSIRKSPIQSATLYKIGTKKKGNDGNIWIIVENKNNVKRWQLYRKPTKIKTKSSVSNKKASRTKTKSSNRKQSKNKTKSSLSNKKQTRTKKSIVTNMERQTNKFYAVDFYDIPHDIKWESVVDKLTQKEKNVFMKLVNNVFPKLAELNIFPVIVPLPISPKGIFWFDFPYDYAKYIYETQTGKDDADDKNYFNVILKLNTNNELSSNIIDLEFIFIDDRRKMINKCVKILSEELPNNFSKNKDFPTGYIVSI